MVPFVLLAIGSLAAEYGYRLPAEYIELLHWLQVIALAGLVLEPVVDAILARRGEAAVMGRWFHFVLSGLLAAAVGVVFALEVPPGTVIYIAQIGIVVNLLMRLVELNRMLALLQVRPAALFVGSFLTLITVGSGLLMLPVATVPGETTTLTDALFTSTSAVCVTGLIVQDTGTHWSTLGRYIILGLIQLGGLGLMTFGSVFALLLWRGMRVRESVVMRDVLSSELVSEVGRVIIFILLTTFAIEAAGALLMGGMWDHTATGDTVSMADRVEYSVFHSISAFCNAGFCLYTDSLMDYEGTWQANVVVPLLIIAGGIGFAVLYNLARVTKYRFVLRRRVPLVKSRLNLQSKLALTITAVLLVAGTGFGLLFERLSGATGFGLGTTYSSGETSALVIAPPEAVGPEKVELGGAPMGDTWWQQLRGAWFLSVTARTAGFNTTDTRRLTPSTKFLTVLLMFIGASPGSTGGGIKTVTFAVIVLGVWSTLRGTGRAQAFKRSLTNSVVRRALTVLAVSAVWVAIVSVMVAAWGMREGQTYSFLDVLFETTSAFATVGLSTGATPLLNTAGRVLIIVTMFVGRVGPLTLFVAIPTAPASRRYDYATENVAIS